MFQISNIGLRHEWFVDTCCYFFTTKNQRTNIREKRLTRWYKEQDFKVKATWYSAYYGTINNVSHGHFSLGTPEVFFVFFLC